MKTFTSQPAAEPVTFMVDEDEFTALPAGQMPGGVINTYFKKVKEGDVFEANYDFFEFVLDEQSFKVFDERFNLKVEQPITVKLLADIATWLLGSVYMGEAGDTEPEAPSSAGQPTKRPGRGSTAGAARKESSPGNSPQPD